MDIRRRESSREDVSKLIEDAVTTGCDTEDEEVVEEEDGVVAEEVDRGCCCWVATGGGLGVGAWLGEGLSLRCGGA